MTWRVGDRVRNRPELAHIYDGSPWAAKLALPREGTVIDVPWFAANNGEGTLLIEWDSLTGPKADPASWRIWVHSNHIHKIEATQ